VKIIKEDEIDIKKGLKKAYHKLDYPSAYEFLAVRYPNHKKLIWLAMQIKWFITFFLFLWIIYSIVNLCNPETLCPMLWELTIQSQNITSLDIFYNLSNYSVTP